MSIYILKHANSAVTYKICIQWVDSLGFKL
jgi:hypothetical protein